MSEVTAAKQLVVDQRDTLAEVNRAMGYLRDRFARVEARQAEVGRQLMEAIDAYVKAIARSKTTEAAE